MDETLFGYGYFPKRNGKTLDMLKMLSRVIKENKTIYVVVDRPQRIVNYLLMFHPGVKYKVDTGGIEINGREDKKL